MKFKQIIFVIQLAFMSALQAQKVNSALPLDTAVSSTAIDTISKHTFSLLDTLQNKAISTSIFNFSHKLKSAIPIQMYMDVNTNRDLPFLKQIKPAVSNNNQWKFWYLLILVLYVALVRLSSLKNFEHSVVSLFDLTFLSNISQWKDTKFTWSSLHIFIIYILSFAYILAQFFAYNKLFNQFSYLGLSITIAGVIFVVYIIKFIVHLTVGYLIDDVGSSIKMIINTIQIANFTSLVLLLFAIFYTFILDNDFIQAIFFTIVGVFFTGILYRLIRYFINQVNKSTLPFFYIFIYICALEISPWLIFIKILNNYLS